MSNDLFERRGQPLGVHSSVRECDDGEAVAEQFQCPQRRLTAVPTSPEILTPEKLVANLMRHKRLKLLGVEEIERPFRDQHDRATVQSHDGLGHLNEVHDLDYVDSFALVQFEYAPRGSQLFS